jgi:RNA polymerase sigma-70 factor (ECF subfamily)
MTGPRDPDQHTQTLALRATQGDAQSVDALLVQYLPRLRAFIRSQVDPKLRLRESVSDMVQSTCREIVAAGPDFDWQGEARFRGWLFTTALNKIRGRVRHFGAKKRGPDAADGDDIEGLVDPWTAANSPSRVAAGHELNATMEAAMDALPADYREVIALSRMAELPHSEVARVMGRSEGAVRTLLSRALCALVAEVDRLEGKKKETE